MGYLAISQRFKEITALGCVVGGLTTVAEVIHSNTVVEQRAQELMAALLDFLTCTTLA